MAFQIKHVGTPRNDRGYVADRNIYLDKDGNVVDENDPTQATQLIGKGGAISTETAEKYGLIKKAKPEAAESSEAKKTPAKANK